MLIVTFGPKWLQKKLASDVLGPRPTTGIFLKKIGDLSAHTFGDFDVDESQACPNVYTRV